MYEALVPKSLVAYGIKYSQIYPFQKGYRNEIWPVKTENGQMINLTFFKREPGITSRIKQADLVSSALLNSGIPVRSRIDTRTLLLKNVDVRLFAGLYNYLPGNTISWESYTKDHIKALGAMMSNMHFHLKDKIDIALPSVYDEYLDIVRGVEKYFCKQDVSRSMQLKLGIKINTLVFQKYLKLLALCKSAPNQQPLHMDFVRGNILFTNKEISGVLDFEKVALGHTVVDISRTFAFLLVDCKYKTSDKITKYFLHSGYCKRGKQKEVGSKRTRDLFVEMFLLYDLYKFLRHNPYESLADNEHYVRTRDILIDIGVVSFT